MHFWKLARVKSLNNNRPLLQHFEICLFGCSPSDFLNYVLKGGNTGKVGDSPTLGIFWRTFSSEEVKNGRRGGSGWGGQIKEIRK